MLMAVVMVLTFIGAVVTMLVGVSGMLGEKADTGPNQSTRLMALRVGLCFCLLLETMVYLAYFKT